MNQQEREQAIALKNVLSNIGMDEKETSVYLALLSTKSASATDLSKIAQLNRATTYFVLDRLQEKGFVSQLDKGKIKHFVAQPVEKLISHAQNLQKKFVNIEQQLHEALPLFQAMTPSNISRPEVQLLHGLSGLKQAYKEILPHEFIGFWNPKIMYKHFGMPITDLLFEKKLPLHGRDLIVQSEFNEQATKDWPQTKDYQYRMLPASVQYDCDVMIWNDKAAFFNYDDQYTVVQIHNKAMTDMFRAWFEIMWSASKDPTV